MKKYDTLKKIIAKKTSSMFIVLLMLMSIILITPVKAYAQIDTIGSGFDSPNGVAVDNSGNVYFTNIDNSTVKRINTDDSITPLGSGFISPNGVAVDNSGDVYIANIGNSTVKRINTDGSIDTLGSGFKSPNGVAVDSSGNVYVADTGNSAVKRINTDGSITPLGSGFKSPNGVAVDSSGNVYVADTGNSAVKRINTDGSIIPLGHGFYSPHGVAVDSSGNVYVVYVAEYRNDSLIRINKDGSITILGSGFDNPNGVAVDSSGNVYVADTGNNAVKKLLSPKVTSVKVPDAKTYKAGDTLDFNVNFDNPVNVNLTGGTPCLSLTLGNKQANAVYKSGSGTSALTFSYTVQSGDSDTDGITANGISLNGGSISSSENVYANLALNNVGLTSGVLVNGVVPTFTNTDAVLRVGANSGSTDISNLLHVSDTAPGHTLTWSISSRPSNGNLTIENISSNSGGSNIAPGGSISYSPSNGYTGTDSFTIQVSDEDGNKSSKTINITVYGLPYCSIGAADSISTTSASLKATVNANYDDTTVTFEYGTSDAYGNTILASPGTVRGGSDTSVSAAISGLLPNTIYYYRVIAQNSFGTSYSAYQTFTTLALPQIQTTNPTSAMVGNAYSYKFTSTGGTGGNTYSVTSGNLPAGLTLSSDGTLCGTPTAYQTCTFEVTVTDNTGEKSSNTFTLSVNQQFTLSYLTNGNGSIQGNATQIVNYLADGTSVTAVPNADYHFVKWSDGDTSPIRQDTGITSNLTVTAEFAINTYTVTFEDYDCTLIGTQTVNYGESANAPQNPVRTGFSFTGWDKDFSNITSDLTVTAKYTRNKYTLSYLTDGNGSIIGDTPQTVDYLSCGTSVVAIPNAGYSFVKWSDGNTGIVRQDTGITGNLTVTAEFAINTYTVTFKDYDGTVIGTQTVNYGESANASQSPTRTGYSFTGWDKDFRSITSDLTVTAEYAINQYSLRYAADSNGSIQGNANQTVNYLADSTSVTANPKAGYHFVKWSDENTNSTRQDKSITSNLTVTAEFAINQYTLSYSTDGNGSIQGNASQTVNYLADSTSVTAVPKTGYHFVKWSDGNTDIVRQDKSITSNLIVTAEFAINQYTLSYSTDGNGSIQGNASQTVNYLADSTSVTAVAKAGYHFVKWSDGKTGMVRQDTGITGNLTVTAEFAINTYTVTFKDYDGTVIGTQTINYGKSANAPQSPVRTGYSFTGWNKDFSNITSDLTITAEYTINQYSLRYATDGNGSIQGNASQTVNYFADGTSVTAVPKTGYHFVKWSDGNTNPIRQDKSITSNLTVTAEFAINQYTLSYSADGNGSIQGNANQTVNYLADSTSVTAVPKAGYHFVKWSDGNTNPTRQDKSITGSLTVTAEFAINQYALSYSADGNGSIQGNANQTVNYLADGTSVTAVPKAGYHFVKWSDGNTNSTRQDIGITSNLIVTAEFAINQYTLSYSTEGNGSIQGNAAQTVNYLADGTSVTAVPKAGYHFVKWSDENTNPTRQDTSITGSLTVTAEFAINTYTVTFEDYDCTVIETQTVNYGESAKAPQSPAKTGYRFANWDKDFSNITSDLTVTAKYTSGNSYTFTADAASQSTDEAAIVEGYFDSRDNTIIVNNNGVTFTIPADAVDITGISNTGYVKTTAKEVEENMLTGSLPDNMQIVESSFEFDIQLFNSQNILVRDIHQFANKRNVQVSIKLTGDELKNIDTSKLSAYYYDESSKTWVLLGGSYNSSTQEFTFMTPHFTKFAIMEKVEAVSKTASSVDTNNTQVLTPHKLVKTGSFFDSDMLICIGSILLLAGIILTAKGSMKKSK